MPAQSSHASEAQPLAAERLISDTLAQFAHDLSFDAIPADVRTRAAHLMLDATGIAYACGRYDFAQTMIRGVTALGGEGDVPVLGVPLKRSPRDAALLSGFLIHGLDFDDTHSGGIIHATASVWPTVISAGWMANASGREMVTAYVAGIESATRLAAVGAGPFHQVGFHPTGLVGIFGSALAAGKLLGLTPAQLVMAQGIALSMASGSMEFLEDGAWTKRLHPGWAAQSAITAVTLAREGFVGPCRAYEGRFGLYNAYLHGIEAARWERATSGLGADWETLAVAVKPLPACHFTHAASDAAAELRRKHAFDLGDIARINVLVPAEVVKTVCEPAANKRRPANAYNAQFSIPYLVAATLVRGQFSLAELENDALTDPAILALCDRVTYEVDQRSTFPRHYTCEVHISLRDGRVLVHREAHNRGCADRPLSNDGIVAKFEGNARMTLSQERADGVRAAMLALCSFGNARDAIARIAGVS